MLAILLILLTPTRHHRYHRRRQHPRPGVCGCIPPGAIYFSHGALSHDVQLSPSMTTIEERQP
jgi:hypothetical protein